MEGFAYYLDEGLGNDTTTLQEELLDGFRLEKDRQDSEQQRVDAEKRTRVRIVLEPEQQQLVMKDMNLPQNVESNEGKGDCLFWTLIQSTIFSGLRMDHHLDSPERVRNEIALWFLQIYHADRFLKVRFPNIKDLENFNRLLVKNGVWTKLDNGRHGFDVIFYVVAKQLNTNIVVCNYSNDTKKWNGIVFRGHDDSHRFFVQLKNQHFQLIKGNDFINSIDLANFEKLD